MKLFLDTAEVDEIKKAATIGIIEGVTTNPSLIAKSGRKFETVIQEIAEIIDGPISAEATATDAVTMVKEGEELAKIHENVIIKVPMTMEGIQACVELSKKEIGVNVTLVFHPNQALLAAKAGALFVSPFAGRLDDIGYDGMGVIDEIVQVYKNYNFQTGVLAASIRNPEHVKRAALAGADAATIPTEVLYKLCNHHLTDTGIERFLKDWESAKK